MSTAAAAPRHDESVPRRRAELDPEHLRRIRAAQQAQERSQDELERAVVDALRAGASVRVIADATGIAGSTIQRYVNRRR